MKQTTYLRGHQAQHAPVLAHLVDPGNQVTLSVTKSTPTYALAGGHLQRMRPLAYISVANFTSVLK